jgi:hypothetical protein
MITSLWILLELELFQTKVVEKTETNMSLRLWNNVGKYGKARQAKYNSITRSKITYDMHSKARIKARTHDIY